jgi:hypothetical protein
MAAMAKAASGENGVIVKENSINAWRRGGIESNNRRHIVVAASVTANRVMAGIDASAVRVTRHHR